MKDNITTAKENAEISPSDRIKMANAVRVANDLAKGKYRKAEQASDSRDDGKCKEGENDHEN